MARIKPISGYEGLYLITDEGDVYSAPKEVFNGRGYYTRPAKKLSPGLRGKKELPYEFVALTKNSADNLEWCTQQYNNEYSHNKRIAQYKNGEKIAEYKNIVYASKITGIGRTSINNALCGWSESAGKFHWEYVKEEE